MNRTDMKIMEYQVLSNDDFKFGYNAATGQYEDLMAAGIIDPTKVCGPVIDDETLCIRSSAALCSLMLVLYRGVSKERELPK